MIRLFVFYTALFFLLGVVSCIEKPIHNETLSHGFVGTNPFPGGEFLSKIQTSLDDDCLLLQYKMDPDPDALIIFALDKKNIQFFPVPLPEKFESEVYAFHELIRQYSLPQKKKRKAFIAQSAKLYDILMAPVETLLFSKNKIMVVGQGVFELIPFDALLSSDESKPFSELDFLMRRFEINFHLSLKTVLSSRNKKKNKIESIFAFAPVFESQNVANDWPYSRNAKSARPLLFSEKEIRTLDALFKTQPSIRRKILMFEKASEKNLKNQLSRTHDIIHIASHSFADMDHPEQSGILCYESAGEDGILKAAEISTMKINSELVVLSSCESGLGKIGSGGVDGIHKRFLEAGAANVLYSLWQVNDRICDELMVDFYSHFLEGASYASALRFAKLRLLENKATSSPNLWAPFVLIGK